MTHQAAPTAPIYECIWHGSEDPDVKTGTAEFLMHTGTRFTFPNLTWLEYQDLRSMITGLWSDGFRAGKAELFRQIKCLVPTVSHDVEPFFND